MFQLAGRIVTDAGHEANLMIDQNKRRIFRSQGFVRVGLISHDIRSWVVKVGEYAQFAAARRSIVGNTCCGCEDTRELRTIGATSLPSSSIARSNFACGNAATLIWNVIREMPPNESLICLIFSATVSGSPTMSAPVGPSRASKCARVTGGQPRSFPISEKLRA